MKYHHKADLNYSNHKWTVRHIAFCYKSQGDLSEALKDYLLTENLDPENRSLLLNIGHLYLELGNIEESLKYYYKVYLFKSIKTLLTTFLLKESSNKILDDYRSKKGSADYKNANHMMRTILSKAVNEDLKHVMSDIKVPTLLIWGKKDTATPLCDAETMNKLIKESGLVAFDNVGHYSFLERPYDFDAIMKNFLKN